MKLMIIGKSRIRSVQTKLINMEGLLGGSKMGKVSES